MSEAATIAKTLILMPNAPLASASIVFATGATAATVVSATVAAPSNPVHRYLYTFQSHATQTVLNVVAYNSRTFMGVATASRLTTSVTLATGEMWDKMVEGSFIGGATGILLRFGINTAATAAEVISASYQIYAIR